MATDHEGYIKDDEVDKASLFIYVEEKWDYLSSFVEKTRHRNIPLTPIPRLYVATRATIKTPVKKGEVSYLRWL